MAKPREGDIVIFISSQSSIHGAGHPTEVIGRVKRDGHGLHAGGKYLDSAIGEVQVLSAPAAKRKPMSMAETTVFKGDIFQIG